MTCLLALVLAALAVPGRALATAAGVELPWVMGWLLEPARPWTLALPVLAFGVAAARLEARSTLRWALAALVLAGLAGALVLLAPIELLRAPLPQTPSSPSRTGALLQRTWSVRALGLVGLAAVAPLLRLGHLWVDDARRLLTGPATPAADEAARVAYVSAPLVLAALVVEPAPVATTGLLLLDPRAAAKATLVLVVLLGVAVARALRRTPAEAGEAPATP